MIGPEEIAEVARRFGVSASQVRRDHLISLLLGLLSAELADDVGDTGSATLHGPDGSSVRVQLLSGKGYPPWPTELRALEQRYSDAPPATLRVPVRAAFAAWKTAAWFDRKAPRDLWDLWALAVHEAIDEQALDLYVRYGPTGNPPSDWLFAEAPSEDEWRTALAGQTRLTVSAVEAAGVVASAWGRSNRPAGPGPEG